MLLNPHTYPNFLRFLQHQGVDLIRSSNSLSVTHHGEKHEWASEGLKGLFCQPRNMSVNGLLLCASLMLSFKKRMYRVMLDVWRFNTLAPEVLGNGFESAVTVGEFLEQEGFSKEFKHDYLLVSSDCLGRVLMLSRSPRPSGLHRRTKFSKSSLSSRWSGSCTTICCYIRVGTQTGCLSGADRRCTYKDEQHH